MLLGARPPQRVAERDAPRASAPAPVERQHLGRAVLAVARACSAQTVLEAASGRFTYRWLAAAMEQVSTLLLAGRGFAAGQRVVLLLENSAEYLAAFYGTLLAGGVAVPLPPDMEAARFEAIVESCEATCVLTSKPALRKRPALYGTAVETLLLTEDAAPPAPETVPADSAFQDGLAALLFTSGSTGEPKGVMLSHGNLLSNALSIAEYLELRADDRALGLLPFYHAFGNSVLQSHVLRGAAVVLGGTLMFPESIVETVRDERLTNVSGVPDVFRLLLTRTSMGTSDLPSLRFMAAAGGALRPGDALELARRIAPARMFVMYGQSEATARLSYLPPERLEAKSGSIGRGIPGVVLEVVDDSGRPVPPGSGTAGEIRARGPNVMLGYWRDEAGTAETLRDGWLYTGDLATIDADGDIYPLGRRNGLVKVGGYRFHPAEVEEFVARRVPELQGVAVPYEPESVGTRLALFLVPREPGANVTAADVRRLCVTELPRHMVPEHVEVLERFPLTDSLKIDRRGLIRRAEEASGALLRS